MAKENDFPRNDSGISSSASQNDMLKFDVLSRTTDGNYETITETAETAGTMSTSSTEQRVESGWKEKFRRLCPPRGPAAKWVTWCKRFIDS